jgi:hydroxyacylglutathione hydrolase
MIIERSMQQDWLSNAYLVGDEENGKAVVIDSGGPSGPLLEAADRHGLDVELLLLTHHHWDHVAENGVWKERHGVQILAHPIEAGLIDHVDRTIDPGETVEVGGLTIESLHTPGHTAGMLNFVVN